jgi:hypothetical protein
MIEALQELKKILESLIWKIGFDSETFSGRSSTKEMNKKKGQVPLFGCMR